MPIVRGSMRYLSPIMSEALREARAQWRKTMSPIEGEKLSPPVPRSWSDMLLVADKHIWSICISGNSITFRSDTSKVTRPVFVITADVLYYPDCVTPADVRAINAAPVDTRVRVSPSSFDFILAQVLISAAMPWTKMPSTETAT